MSHTHLVSPKEIDGQATEAGQLPLLIGTSPEANVERTPGELAYLESVSVLAERLPEVVDRREETEKYGTELVREFAIHPEVFENQANTMFLSALSQRYATLEANRDSMTVDAYTKEKTFIGDATILLALDRSDYYEEYRDLINERSKVTDEQEIRILDRFTNKEVTADLQAAIDAGLLDNAKKRAGITAENEDPVVLHVLNIGDKDTLYGMRPIARNMVYGDEYVRQVEDNKLYEGYAEGLGKRAKEFMAQMDLAEIPLAWSQVQSDGSRHLCVALPTAEKLLYTDQKRSGLYTEEHRLKEQATVEHEYGHLEGESMMPDRNIFYGLAFEERRAEQIAGNKMGYEDAKGFIDIDLTAILGVNLTEEGIVKAEKGGNGRKFWVGVAEIFGMQAALEMALAIPASYEKDWRPLQKEVNRYLGGFNGVEQRLYENLSPERKADADMRFGQWAKGHIAKPDSNTSWRNNRRNLHNLHYVTDKLEDTIKRLEKESATDAVEQK